MGCCKSKNSKLDIQIDLSNNLLNINVGQTIINLYKNQSEYNYTNNLNSAIKLYKYEKELNHNLELDYVTKCIIVMSFIRDIDKVLNRDKSDIKNLHLPIFIIEVLESYKKNTIENNVYILKYIEWMKKYDIDNIDNIDNINEEQNLNMIKSEEQKLNIIIGLINNIYVI